MVRKQQSVNPGGSTGIDTIAILIHVELKGCSYCDCHSKQSVDESSRPWLIGGVVV